MAKYFEVTVKRTRVIEEEAVLEIADHELRGMSNADLETLAAQHGLFVEVNSVVTEVTSEDTTQPDERDSYDTFDTSDDSYDAELEERAAAYERARDGEVES